MKSEVTLLLKDNFQMGTSIQYGFTKLGTHARVISQTHPHGNIKIKIRQ